MRYIGLVYFGHLSLLGWGEDTEESGQSEAIKRSVIRTYRKVPYKVVEVISYGKLPDPVAQRDLMGEAEALDSSRLDPKSR